MSVQQEKHLERTSCTFDEEVRYHIAEFFDMLRQVQLARDTLKAFEAFCRKPCCDPSKLMNDTKFGEPCTSQSKVTNVLRLISSWGRWRPETLLREIFTAVKTHQLLGIFLDVVEYLA